MKIKKFIKIMALSALSALLLCSCKNTPTDPVTTTTDGKTASTLRTTVASDTATTQAQIVTLPEANESDVNIVFISAGKADSILIMAGGKNYMIDTGEKGKDNFKLTDKILKLYDIKAFDGIFLSHTHNDHTGGLKRIAEKYGISCIYSAELHTTEDEIAEMATELGLKHELLKAGDRINVTDGIYFDVIAPLTLDYSRENNNSMVIMLTANGKKTLFTGDMEFPEEATLLDSETDLDADILKVANHGNPDASSSRFLKAVSPDYAVICTDRSVDTDSANEAVINTLPETEFYITDEYTLGVFFTIKPDGTISVVTK